MSVRVGIEELDSALEGYAWGYVVTIDDESRAHLVAVPTAFSGGRFHCATGDRTRRNAMARPALTMVFPPTAPGGYSLIVDGTATVDGDRLVIQPTQAVLHRPAIAAE